MLFLGNQVVAQGLPDRNSHPAPTSDLLVLADDQGRRQDNDHTRLAQSQNRLIEF